MDDNQRHLGGKPTVHGHLSTQLNLYCITVGTHLCCSMAYYYDKLVIIMVIEPVLAEAEVFFNIYKTTSCT